MFDLSFLPLSDRVELPAYGTDESAGLDVRAFLPETGPLILDPGDSYTMPLGFATAFPPGFGILEVLPS